MTTIAITMAGQGQRFRDAGFDVPKHEIRIHGRTLFGWALASLRSWLDEDAHVVFIARATDRPQAFLAHQCALDGIPSYAVIELGQTTDGQATTALLAAPAIRSEHAPFVVYNIDTHVRPYAMRAQDPRGEGWIPVFPGEGSAWSFAAADAQGRVSAVREKERISPHATVGLYWFDSFARYADLYDRHYAAGDNVAPAGERYIAPMYNTMIDTGCLVTVGRLALDDVIPLGTPAEAERFAAAAPPISSAIDSALARQARPAAHHPALQARLDGNRDNLS